MNFLIYVLEDTQETGHFDVTKTRQSSPLYMGLEFLMLLNCRPGARAQFWIRSPLTFSLSALRPMTGSSISAAIPVRTFPGWRVILYACARPGTHSLILFFFFFWQWPLLGASSRYARKRISDRRGGATTCCLWGSSPTFPKRFMIPPNPIRLQSRVVHTNSCDVDGEPKVIQP